MNSKISKLVVTRITEVVEEKWKEENNEGKHEKVKGRKERRKEEEKLNQN